MQLNKWFTHIAEAVSQATGHAWGQLGGGR
jgi:hypothetical protein